MNTLKTEARSDGNLLFHFSIRALLKTMASYTPIVPTGLGKKCPVCDKQVIQIRSSEYCIGRDCIWSNK